MAVSIANLEDHLQKMRYKVGWIIIFVCKIYWIFTSVSSIYHHKAFTDPFLSLFQDKHNKVYLQWLKDQRTKKLKSLKMSNFERYVELIKELDIEPLASTHSKYAKYKFRQFKIGVEIKEKKSQAVWKNPAQLKHAK